jgi:acetyl esterase/lipase
MELERVDPAVRAATAKLPVPDVTRPLMRRIIRFAMRLLPTPALPGVTRQQVRFGSGRVQVYRPVDGAPRGGLLWVHGGGFVIGSWRQDHRHCAETARDLGIVVVAAEYRLAPEHPFPAALDDVHAAWGWLQANAATLGIPADRMAVGGESAGGGLAAGLVQRLHDEGGPQPVAQWLYAPMLDDRTAADRSLDEVNHWVWNNTLNRFGWSAYLGQAPGEASVRPYAVPGRRDDVTGLPDAWIGVGDIDLFHDEDARYAARLTDAGVSVTLDVVPGGPHGFENWAKESEPARALHHRARTWLGARLAGHSAS